MNDIKVDYQISIEENYKSTDYFGNSNVPVRREWYVCNLFIEPESNNFIVVNYIVKNNYLEELWVPFGNAKRFDYRFFSYDFTPAAGWGNGIAKTFKFHLTSKSPNHKTERIKVRGLDGNWISDSEFIYVDTDFSFTENESFNILYDNSLERLEEKLFHMNQKINKDITAIETSSTLPSTNNWDYSNSNLFDGNILTAWVEGVSGTGLNEKIIIELDNPIQLQFLGLANGFRQNEKTYIENSKVKKLEVTLYNDENRIEQKVTLDFPNRTFIELNEDNLFDVLELEMFWEDMAKINKIELSIKETYPGTKYEDTCISEIYITHY
jgi:hypothetical protein